MNMKISKKLSANDIGTTGSHQAGILIPKIPEILSFFPRLDPNAQNPRVKISVSEVDQDFKWIFNFIYYNNLFTAGTRNEYRLTGMTRYLRDVAAESGDEIIFHKNEQDKIFVGLKKQYEPLKYLNDNNVVIVLNKDWSLIR